MRRRWTQGRVQSMKDAQKIIGWIKENNSLSTREIITRLKKENMDIQAHVLNRALVKSPFIRVKEKKEVNGKSVTIWEFFSEV
ncbi:MAG: hypothetical protein CMA25_01705 [Euryarchaeota archaeon]|nr:hypothetical protein [Euryarchaeota archaeon]